MLIVTTEAIPGKTFEVIGYVTGATVQSRHFGKDIAAGLKTIVGGEIKGYTEMMDAARAQATHRMVQRAQEMGANAVIGLRYASSSVMQGAAEVMAYGTAVIVLP